MDKIQHHYHSSIFSLLGRDNWWNPEISWNNKYRFIDENDNRFVKRFHTSVLVIFSDAFHFFKSIRDNSLLLCIAITIPCNLNILLTFIVIKIIYSTLFHIFYMYLFKK